MPVVIRRLLQSDTWVLGTDSERSAAIALWLESWHQIPAASLPNNDRMLAHLAQSRSWNRVKKHVMAGFTLCNDGRWYHPVVSEKALESWIEKLLALLTGSIGNAKRWGIEVDVDAKKEQLISAIAMLRALSPDSKVLKKKGLLTLLAALANPPNGQDSEDTPDSAPNRPPIGPLPEKHADAIAIDIDIDIDRDSLFKRGSSRGPSAGADELPLLLVDEHGNSTVDPPGPTNPPAAPIPNCDHKGVLALWAELMPGNPQPRRWTPTRSGHLQARWRELFAEGKAHNAEEALAWFAKFFRYLAKSRFLTGRAIGSNGRPPFQAQLDWVMRPENFANCIEGKYHQED